MRRGSKTWTTLVEVNTGSNCLERKQLEAYLDIAREQGFDGVLTISNEIAAVPGVHPTAVDRRKLRKVALQHLSWTQVLTEAVMQKVHRGVTDPDQSWILGELIRYLEHDRSGAMEFDSMGQSWVTVRDAIAAGTLRANDKGATDVVSRWDQLILNAGLRLGRQLGVEVQPLLSKKERLDPASRTSTLLSALESSGSMSGVLRIPNAVGPVTICADLRAGRVTASVEVDAPKEGRPLTRVNWLVRQLKDAPESVRVDCFTLHGRGASTSELLKDLRGNPSLLIADPKREIRSFRVAHSVAMGAKQGQGRGSFVGSVLRLLDDFYGTTVQTIKPWSAAPPRLRSGSDEQPDVPKPLVSTSLSSQDGADDRPPENRPASEDPVSERAPVPVLDGASEGDPEADRSPTAGSSLVDRTELAEQPAKAERDALPVPGETPG